MEKSGTSSGQLMSSSAAAGPSSPKRPAGRTKFQETRHPVYRGVRRRGRAGRWVCEVRVPGGGGDRLWVGTFDTADDAARAHDAAMIALCGASAPLNFPDSVSLLRVHRSPALSSGAAGNGQLLLPDVQRAAAEAVAEFQRRGGGGGGVNASSGDDAAAIPPLPPAAAELDNGVIHGDVFGDMGADLYYASLAEGLLMDPPPTMTAAGDCCCDDDGCGGGGGGELELWS